MPQSPSDAAGAPSPPCTLCDFLWEAFAIEGSAALERGDEAAAEACWRTAAALTLGFHGADPRRAATLTAEGALAALKGDARAAQASCRRALEQWRRAPEWIAGMAIELKARSSLFHFRIESRHRDELVSLARAQNEHLAAAGRAAAEATLAGLLAAEGSPAEALGLYREAIAARAKGLSHREEAVGWLNEDLAPLLAACGQPAEAEAARARACAILRDPVPAGPRRFAAGIWPKMTDIRRLTAAVELAPLLRRAQCAGGAEPNRRGR